MSTKQEQFIHDLVQFYRNRGVNNAHAKQFITRLNGKVVNLSELYSYVLEAGGSYRVNQSNLWDEIYGKLFKTSNIGANFAVALRQIFNRYLLQYEKTCSGQNNFASEQWNEDEDEENIFSSTNQHSNSLATLAKSTQISQDLNNVTDSSGQVHNDAKLYCSLLSGLPNELNFAFNVATILSNCNRFDWTNDYKFINVLLESMRSYCCICDQYEEDITFGRTALSDDEDEIVLFKQFIHSSISHLNISKTKSGEIEGEIEGLNGNSSTNSCEDDNNPLPSCPKKKAIEFIDKRCNCYRQFWYRKCLDEETLNVTLEDDIEVDFALPFVFKDIPAHLMRKIEQRIELIAGIILNISVTYDQLSCNNVNMMSLLKFLVLLLRSENPSYLNLSLDILSNISPSLAFQPSKLNAKSHSYLLDVLLRSIVKLAITSNNLHNTTKSFEILARYISSMNSEANAFLETYFEGVKLYERITHLLTCQYDIALLLALLEFCLTLSEARPFLLVQSDNKVLIKILVNLLNCEASQHFTTGAFKKVKVVDDRPKPEVTHSVIPNMVQQNANVPVVNQAVKGNAKPTILNTLAVSNVTQNVLDNESFAISWLRMTYEDAPGCSFKVSDIYAEYLKHCCRNSRKNVIAAQSFSFLIKRCFPSCNLNANQTIVEGLTVKGALVANASEIQQRQTSSCGQVVSQHPQLMSPILKAHLSTPPKNNALPLPGTPTPNDLNQATATTTNTSTLIKSLLANKLRNNQQTVSSTPPSSPIIVNSPKPIPTQVTTQTLGNSSNTVMIANENANIKDLNLQKSIVFASNATTTYTITPSTALANNIIVSNANIQQQPHLQGTQQILLVRTILGAPGQQNPVRLILPASMITQQRLQAPLGTAVNGLIAGNNVMQTISAPIMQTQLSVPSSQISANLVMNNTPTVATSQAVAGSSARNSIANSSPLLNVLLDKGKLPDFPSQSAAASFASTSSSIANNGMTVNTTSSMSPLVQMNQQQQQQQQQPKMYILTATPNKPIGNCLPNSTTANDSVPTNNSLALINNTPTVVDGKSSAGPAAPLLITTPMVNGDLKPLMSNSNSVPSNSVIKHALENSASPAEVIKRLKTSNVINSIADNLVTDNGVDKAAVVMANHVESRPHSNGNDDTVANNGIDSPSIGLSSSGNSDEFNQTSSKQLSADSDFTSIPVANALTGVVSIPPPIPFPPAPPKVEVVLEFECQWNDCQMKFARPSEVFYHVHSAHIMTPSFPNIMNCLWGGPEGKGPGCLAKRPKLSLLTHLQDFHCNPTIVKQELLRKRQLSLMGSTNVILPQPPAHPGYAQNAAMIAIRRHATNYVEAATAPSTVPISPLTVSIRLTSALILRNLAERSHLVKKSLEIFESQLCEISIAEGRDESRTIAQCLAVISDQV